MKEWQKIGYLGDGVIYACGNKRKVITHANPAIYYELKGCEIRWYQPRKASNREGFSNEQAGSHGSAG